MIGFEIESVAACLNTHEDDDEMCTVCHVHDVMLRVDGAVSCCCREGCWELSQKSPFGSHGSRTEIMKQ